jgi:hypothetical protein
MKYKTGIPALFLCLALLRLAVAAQAPQDETTKPENSPAPKTTQKKTKISVHIIVSAEGHDKLPSGSRIDLQGREEACKDVQRLQQSIGPDGTTFLDLPICRVELRIYITGFDTKIISVDLAAYKNPMRVLVKSKRPPVISW